MSKILQLIFVCVLSLWCLPAMAYIDPGSGSAIMSAVVGFFLVVTIAIKGYWYKLRAFFGFKSSITKRDQKEASKLENEE